ncbi:RHO protein signal transduction [Scheffersomyces xylosifermentans]|uniref:RHO protein signal transduction n=1 Tax=Scheffersomyces xylosifermentans TaxID=1304137 RepID=UPI00315D56D8
MANSVYICIKQFNARLGDELSLKVGDKVEVLADDSEYNDGWYMGKNLLTGDVGLYPKTFTQLLKKQEKPLMRSRSRRMTSSTSVNSKEGKDSREQSPAPNGTTSIHNNIPTTSSNLKETRSAPSAEVTQLSENIQKLNGKSTFKSTKKNDNSDNSTFSNESNNSMLALKTLNGSKSNFASHDASSSENANSNSSAGASTNTTASTMSEIDKALKELHSEPRPGAAAVSDSDVHSNKSKSAPVEVLNPRDAESWTPQQVSLYFSHNLGFEQDVAEKFAHHKITGPILFELDLSHLKELDIDSFGTRFEIHKEIVKLKEICGKTNNLDQGKSLPNAANGASNGGYTTSDPKANGFNKIRSLVNPSTINPNTVAPQSTRTPDNSSPVEEQFHSPENESFNATRDLPHNNSDEERANSKPTQLMPSAPLSSTVKDNGFYKGHSRRRSQSMDNLTSPKLNGKGESGSYSFGGEDNGLYLTRTNVSRPSSSVYEQSLSSHKKTDSQTSVVPNLHRRNSSVVSAHKRHSSLFSFLGGGEEKSSKANGATGKLQSNNLFKEDTKSLISPAQVKRENGSSTPVRNKLSTDSPSSTIDIDDATLSPHKSKSISYRNNDSTSSVNKDDKRSVSDASAVGRLKNLKTTSTQNFKSLTSSRKAKTSAFQEGIRDVTPDEAIKSASFSGWMSKRSSNTVAWRSRYFTLHGTRLSYFASLRDKKEKGLIDITAHKVIPISTESDDINDRTDKYNALYASSTFNGSYCFKLVPPAPGFRKGLTFTQPKTHYFAVDSQEEMRGWIKALMTATIDIDDTVPVVSSCSTPTVSLSKAQELLAKAREETKLKDEELRAQGYLRDGIDEDYNQFLHESHHHDFINTTTDTSSVDETTVSSGNPPKLSVDTNLNNGHNKFQRTPSTPQISSTSGQSGFASPYLLASGLLSPKSNVGSSPSATPPSVSRFEQSYFNENNQPGTASTTETTPKSVYSNGRIMAARKRSQAEKMLAYTSDASGNHSFVIKSKK